MRIPEEAGGGQGAAARQLLQMQADFHAKLMEETTRYLRSLQTVLGPAAPGTLFVPDTEEQLSAAGPPGGSTSLQLDIHNEQLVHCVVSPALSPLVSRTGTTWFVAAEPVPAYLLVPPGHSAGTVIRIPIPDEIPPGDYRGVLLLHGLTRGAAVAISIQAPPPEPADAGSAAEPADPPESPVRNDGTEPTDAVPTAGSGDLATRGV